MTDTKNKYLFSAEVHAHLFACIAKAVMETDSAKGESVIRQGVREYGLERGRRMTLRASSNGHKLNMLGYLTYSEIKTAPGEMDLRITAKVPHVRACAYMCPWYSNWEKHGMTDYGRYYCLEVDRALVSGFNRDLQLDVNCTKTNGAEYCEFVFHDANITIINFLVLLYRKYIFPGDSVIKSWITIQLICTGL